MTKKKKDRVSSTTKTAVPGARRGTVHFVNPTILVLVTDKKHPLYDERVHLQPDLALAKSMNQIGFMQNKPISVRKNGAKFEVVDGRRRTKAAVLANEIRVKNNDPELSVPITLERGEDARALDILIASNEMAHKDDPITKARKMARHMQQHGRSVEETSVLFGITSVSVENHLKLLELHPEVQQAIAGGNVGMTAAVKNLSKLPREKQPTALKKIVTHKVPAQKAAAEGGAPEPRTRVGVPKPRLREWVADHRDSFNERELLLLEFILGSAKQSDFVAQYPGLREHLP